MLRMTYMIVSNLRKSYLDETLVTTCVSDVNIEQSQSSSKTCLELDTQIISRVNDTDVSFSYIESEGAHIFTLN